MVAWAAQDLCSFAASIALFLRPLGASMCTTAAFCIPSIIWLQVKLFALGLVYLGIIYMQEKPPVLGAAGFLNLSLYWKG
jgi:hypothetical protein